MPPPRPYDRAPSPEFLKHLRLAGILEPLLSLDKEKTGELGLDLHFRRNDEIHVYCGMTRILIAKFLRGRGVRITAHRTYATQACARDLFRTWHVGESGPAWTSSRQSRCRRIRPSRHTPTSSSPLTTPADLTPCSTASTPSSPTTSAAPTAASHYGIGWICARDIDGPNTLTSTHRAFSTRCTTNLMSAQPRHKILKPCSCLR